ncbi:hypothetical protein AgCh_017590 [Apium graveolens]
MEGNAFGKYVKGTVEKPVNAAKNVVSRVSWTEFEEFGYKKNNFEKEASNVAYKKKDFENAIKCYSQAVELDDTDISFLMNRVAVYLEMGKIETGVRLDTYSDDLRPNTEKVL